MRWPCVANVVDVKTVHRILVRKPEGEDGTLEFWTSIKIYLKSLVCEDEDWGVTDSVLGLVSSCFEHGNE